MRFVHTADWQIGMKAAHVGKAAEKVRSARLETIRRIQHLARESNAEFVLLAGDTFEDHGVGIPKAEAEVIGRARDILALVGLRELRDEYAKNLSGGQKKLLEIARALMAQPKLVLLDEPVAGVNPTLAKNILDMIESLRKQGITFFLVEHDMDVVMKRCAWIIVMHQGRRLAEGPPDEIKANPRVIDSYLGG